jgi:Zn finger protein HypA/HybF involved in hydrogenase expression
MWPGNTTDVKTLIPVVDRLRGKFNIERICIVADRGMISKDTVCEGAVLNFERIPAQMKCLDCGLTYSLSRGLEACPECDGFRVRVVAGDEFRLESIEVEEAASRQPSADG